jgi:hypothetical protein
MSIFFLLKDRVLTIDKTTTGVRTDKRLAFLKKNVCVSSGRAIEGVVESESLLYATALVSKWQLISLWAGKNCQIRFENTIIGTVHK